MKQNSIDYYCFCVDSLEEPFWENFNINKNGESFRNDLLFDVENSTKIGKCVFYVKDWDKFVLNGEPVDISGKIIFPRCAVFDSNLLLSKIEQNGGKSICTLKDKAKVSDWPRFCQPIHHKVIETTKEEFVSNFEKYKQKLGRIFFKTKEKNFSCEVVNISELGNVKILSSEDDLESDLGVFSFLSTKLISTKDRYGNLTGHDNRLANLDDNEKVFIESFIDIETNKISGLPEEYRCFVLNGEIANISNYFAEENMDENYECFNFVNSVLQSLPNDFPKYFVLDICKIKKDNKSMFDIVEFNSIEASGYGTQNTIIPQEDLAAGFDLYKNNSKEL